MATAKKDLKYFMRSKEPEIVTVPGPDSFRDDEGNVINLEIKVLTNAEIQKINNNYRKRSIATDKKGQPYISNGEVVYKTERDSARATRHIMVEALVYPDLKDKQLMEYYGCVDVTDMPQLVFSRTDEYSQVMDSIMTVLGLKDESTEDEDIDEAKN